MTTIGICDFAVFADAALANLQRSIPLNSSYTIKLGDIINIEIPHVTSASGTDLGVQLRLKDESDDFIIIQNGAQSAEITMQPKDI